MLDLIELTNREVVILMSFSFIIGFLAGVVLLFVPVQTKLDTILRNIEITSPYSNRKS